MKFTKDHEWIKIEGDVAIIGITKYAADALGELVYVELPKISNSYNKHDAFAVVESSKSASDVYIPVAGEVVAINDALTSQPELINNSTYENGWIAKVKISNKSDLDDAMDETAYKKLLQD
ncbi:MAG: glycine cleavage system protein H [Alphaproteobacteria bacterium RIFCSPLOWO2_01_FULL_40_26]|nr:MAG: glycine cleavage system protein H [Alphaproteobacteria bacterium RIFCSPHIGHO2_02_FULL_40_34]OFW94211.1 MAG: glycine cleavage system protein H [Alphaproteobacteria bacterium RIFCSPLOWO2_01_FULL_40_26]OFX09780.1 MAG: glycine cleavage system protein H [Alphaproteobacteria bacterium RIFCSPLOWO2_02_FULL_40_19]OFX12219.1 MAG: glycine cleavage system protein H [Alphaproteobacteria bacterium RIFCSPLOWO2_12_FULL_40_11]